VAVLSGPSHAHPHALYVGCCSHCIAVLAVGGQGCAGPILCSAGDRVHSQVHGPTMLSQS